MQRELTSRNMTHLTPTLVGMLGFRVFMPSELPCEGLLPQPTALRRTFCSSLIFPPPQSLSSDESSGFTSTEEVQYFVMGRVVRDEYASLILPEVSSGAVLPHYSVERIISIPTPSRRTSNTSIKLESNLPEKVMHIGDEPPRVEHPIVGT